jgi:hypothetical protein
MRKTSKATIVKTIFIFLFLIVGLCILYYLWLCPVMFHREYEELLRLPSPDSRVDAVLMQGNAGAMSSFSYDLYVVPVGHAISEKDIVANTFPAVFSAEKMSGEKIKWLMNRVLEIKYTKAQIGMFRNQVCPISDDAHYEIEVRETPLTEPPSLP